MLGCGMRCPEGSKLEEKRTASEVLRRCAPVGPLEVRTVDGKRLMQGRIAYGAGPGGYVDRLQAGTFQWWDEKGQLIGRLHFKEEDDAAPRESGAPWRGCDGSGDMGVRTGGVLTGTAQRWFADGSLALDAKLDASGLPVGTWRVFYAKDKPAIEVGFSHHVPTGDIRFWHKDGTLGLEGRIVDGKAEGLWLLRDGAGADVLKVRFQRGKLAETLFRRPPPAPSREADAFAAFPMEVPLKEAEPPTAAVMLGEQLTPVTRCLYEVIRQPIDDLPRDDIEVVVGPLGELLH